MLVRSAMMAIVVASLVSAEPPALPLESEARSVLKRAATTSVDGQHLVLLFGLRQLRDPDLVPLFERLVRSDDWSIQVHAALGLAEASTDGLDPAVLGMMVDQAQGPLLASAIDAGLVDDACLDAILANSSLTPMTRLLAAGDLLLARTAP